MAVLTGNAHCFSAGGDIRELASLDDAEMARHVHADYLELYRSWYTVPVPTIAAIRGYALGGALELALSCDLRYATEESFFAASGVKMGLVESAHSLPTVVHDTTAAEMLFTAPPGLGRRGRQRPGLVTRVVSDLEQDVAEVADVDRGTPAARGAGDEGGAAGRARCRPGRGGRAGDHVVATSCSASPCTGTSPRIPRPLTTAVDPHQRGEGERLRVVAACAVAAWRSLALSERDLVERLRVDQQHVVRTSPRGRPQGRACEARR